MVGVAALSAGLARNSIRRRKQSTTDPDPDEKELVSFEETCHMMNTQHYRGFRKLQVHIWLLFEDASSSAYAQIVQTILTLLIILSTILIVTAAAAAREPLPPLRASRPLRLRRACRPAAPTPSQ